MEIMPSEEKIQIESIKDLGPFLEKQNNTKNSVYFSNIPEICKTEPCVLGVDEAGRGPVLGPMVYGISYCPIKKSDLLKDLGCADSKQLTEELRDGIFNKLLTEDDPKNSIGWAVDVISPNYISNNMLKRTKYSLNEISMDAAINLIKTASELDVNITEVYVDTVGPPEKYQDKLSKIFPNFKITVAKKADSTYPIVSCASICAKVTRDHALKVWKFSEGLELTYENFGSGYPGDPVTKSFLQNNIEPVFGFPKLVRFSWSTASNMLEGKSYKVEFNENEDESVKKPKGKPITSFFSNVSSKKRKSRHTFFKNRHLDNVTEL